MRDTASVDSQSSGYASVASPAPVSPAGTGKTSANANAATARRASETLGETNQFLRELANNDDSSAPEDGGAILNKWMSKAMNNVQKVTRQC